MDLLLPAYIQYILTYIDFIVSLNLGFQFTRLHETDTSGVPGLPYVSESAPLIDIPQPSSSCSETRLDNSANFRLFLAIRILYHNPSLARMRFGLRR